MRPLESQLSGKEFSTFFIQEGIYPTIQELVIENEFSFKSLLMQGHISMIIKVMKAL